MLKHAGGVLSSLLLYRTGGRFTRENCPSHAAGGERKGRFTRADFCVIMPVEALTASIFHKK